VQVPHLRSDRLDRAWLLGGACVFAYLAATLASWSRVLTPDEVRPLLLAQGSLADLLAFARADMIQTPLSYVFQKLWLDALGHTDTVAKALPFAVNAASLLLFAHISRRCVPNWPIATLLFALFVMRPGSTINLVRMYDFVVLFGLIGLHCWERWRTQGRDAWLVAWGAAMVAGIYSHPSGGLLIPGFLVANAVAGRRQAAIWIAGALASASLLGWIAWTAPVIAERGLEANLSACYSPPWRALARLPFFFLSGEGHLAGAESRDTVLHGPALRWTLTWAARLLLLALVAFAGKELSRRVRARLRGEAGDLTLALLALAGVPVATLLVVSLVSYPILSYRYLLVVSPMVCLALAGLAAAGGRAGKAVLAAAVLPWFAVSAGAGIAQHAGPDALRAGLDRMAREHRAGDLILADSAMPYGYQVGWEWSRRLGRSEPVVTVRRPTLPYLEARWPGAAVDALPLADARRIWLFRHGSRKPDVRPVLIDAGFSSSGRSGPLELLERTEVVAN
jgi:hypothetical protein